MDFRQATDALFDRIDHEDLAKALGVSVATIRQARLHKKARARRSPPSGWDATVLELAERRLAHFDELVRQLRTEARPLQNRASDHPSKSAAAPGNALADMQMYGAAGLDRAQPKG